MGPLKMKPDPWQNGQDPWAGQMPVTQQALPGMPPLEMHVGQTRTAAPSYDAPTPPLSGAATHGAGGQAYQGYLQQPQIQMPYPQTLMPMPMPAYMDQG